MSVMTEGVRCRTQFPNLSHLARNILSIPGAFLFPASKYYFEVSKGSAIVVEHIFAGMCDIISLRRASHKPEAIHTYMLVKERWRFALGAIQDILGH
jgi:hypothetical protein